MLILFECWFKMWVHEWGGRRTNKWENDETDEESKEAIGFEVACMFVWSDWVWVLYSVCFSLAIVSLRLLFDSGSGSDSGQCTYGAHICSLIYIWLFVGAVWLLLELVVPYATHFRWYCWWALLSRVHVYALHCICISYFRYSECGMHVLLLHSYTLLQCNEIQNTGRKKCIIHLPWLGVHGIFINRRINLCLCQYVYAFKWVFTIHIQIRANLLIGPGKRDA